MMTARNNHFTLAGLLVLALCNWSALAQSGAPAPAGPPTPPDGDVMFYSPTGPGPEGLHDPIAFVGFEGGFDGKTVTGVPFTATTSVQTTQVLADGNQIQRANTGTMARDSQGRTRRDMTLPAIGPWVAAGKSAPQVSMINDPVASVHYILEPDKKIARQISVHGHKYAGKHHASSSGAAASDSPDQKFDQKEVTTTALGAKSINGISATGTRITRTIPAGAIGNEKPIIITIERWYSADLQTVVMTKRSDPRTGDFVMQLTNIQRTEPDASLFQVPADYTVEKGRPKGAHGPRPLAD